MSLQSAAEVEWRAVPDATPMACSSCRAVEALTGLGRAGFDDLVARLEPVWAERRRRALDRPDRLARAGGGRKHRLTFGSRLLLAVLHSRWDVTYRALGALFGVGSQMVERTCRDLRPLLPSLPARPAGDAEQRGSRLLVAELERLAIDRSSLLREVGTAGCDRCAPVREG